MGIRIGTRGSKLALRQAGWIKTQIETVQPGTETELIIVSTKGDRVLDTPLHKIGDKGLFTKELEEALYENRIDAAVHSLKDLPSVLPPGLCIGAMPRRGDVRDVLLTRDGTGIENLPEDAVIGTASLRRSAQLLHLNNRFRITNCRGNVETRIAKMDGGEYDAVILAAAGVTRLDLANRIGSYLDPEHFLPAVGQGVIGVEIRNDDTETAQLLRLIEDEKTTISARAERAFLAVLEGGCQVPIGCYSKIDGSRFRFIGLIAELDGSLALREEISGEVSDASGLAETAARRLLDGGGAAILEKAYRGDLSR